MHERHGWRRQGARPSRRQLEAQRAARAIRGETRRGAKPSRASRAGAEQWRRRHRAEPGSRPEGEGAMGRNFQPKKLNRSKLQEKNGGLGRVKKKGKRK